MNNDMISVPRELLERICHIYASSPWPAWYELRALLAQPNTCTKDGGQCEPLAYLDLEKIQHGTAYATKMRVNHRQTAMYAKQPAPVVLPERKPDSGPDPFGNKGWNAYDDELKRLNPTL
ncbi:hypothetical protein [Pseudomonas sp. RIT-To-2]|uniref:hypothetical protein n=1 Tax=Pseudomonas sp. RIT-To-2 TaxID=3462541 RepID=UPI002413AB56